MPELNGYQLAERIRGTGWGSRALLIAISGWGQEQDKRQALAAGFDQHLTKPIDPNVPRSRCCSGGRGSGAGYGGAVPGW